ncbi:MAG: TetR/AcrR family transcriptional regulator [Acidimicrobiales bacterium]
MTTDSGMASGRPPLPTAATAPTARVPHPPAVPGSGPLTAAGEPATDPASPALGIPARKRVLRAQGRQTMRKLLDAAMEVLDERGYHGTRVNDVVKIANTSHGTFYLYFSNKEDLIRALTMEAASEASSLSRDALVEAGTALDGESWDHLRRWIGDYSALWSRYAPLFRSWTDLAVIDDGVGDQVRRMISALNEAMALRIIAAHPTGDLDPEVTGMAVLAMLDRFHFMREFMGRAVDESALDTLATMVHRALFTPVVSETTVRAAD